MLFLLCFSFCHCHKKKEKSLALGKITYPSSAQIENFKNSPLRRIKQFKISTILHLEGPKLFFQGAKILGIEIIFHFVNLEIHLR
jgi:hypothetical protein